MKFQSLEEVKDNGFIILDSEQKYEEVTENIRILLKKEDVVDYTLIDMLGLSRQSYHKYISDPKTLPLSIALRIAAIFDCSVEDLFRLGKDGWLTQIMDKKTYIRMDSLEVVSRNQKNEYIKETGYVYYRESTGELLSEKEDKLDSDIKELFRPILQDINPKYKKDLES